MSGENNKILSSNKESQPYVRLNNTLYGAIELPATSTQCTRVQSATPERSTKYPFMKLFNDIVGLVD